MPNPIDGAHIAITREGVGQNGLTRSALSLNNIQNNGDPGWI